MTTKKGVYFSKHFLWGVSTSAHQVEGGNHNQWSAWELENAKARAHAAEYHLSELPVWPAIKEQAKRPENYISGKAVEHYERYEADFDIAKQMHLNAFRFSVEWSRVEPTEGAWNIEAIEHYKRYVLALKKRGIEPIMTLFHFTLPEWFANKGGFEKRSNVAYFVRFAEKIVSELGPSVRYIITINEPETYAIQSYLQGNWPPARQSKKDMIRVYRNLAVAHKRSAAAIRKLNRRYKISIAPNIAYIYAGDDARLSMVSAAVMKYFSTDYFLKKVYKSCDFLSVNYYFSNRVYGYRVHNPDVRVSDLGWDLSPDNLEYVLEQLYRKYHLPLIVSENGVADMNDEHRQWWLSRSIVAIRNALDQGVDVRGYMHWSLLDNFEWAYGKWPRFGLVAVDYETMQRTIRSSGKRYANFIAKLQKGD